MPTLDCTVEVRYTFIYFVFIFDLLTVRNYVKDCTRTKPQTVTKAYYEPFHIYKEFVFPALDIALDIDVSDLTQLQTSFVKTIPRNKLLFSTHPDHTVYRHRKFLERYPDEKTVYVDYASRLLVFLVDQQSTYTTKDYFEIADALETYLHLQAISLGVSKSPFYLVCFNDSSDN